MTSVEKRLNKDDLIAYKNYDNRQYAMIPGYVGHRKDGVSVRNS
jgi:hypothetical protein